MTKIPTVSIYGIPVSKMNMQQTVEHLTRVVESRTPSQVITANPIMVMAALENPEYMDMMKKAELIVPDGTGLVWAAQYVGTPVAERVPGIDLMHQLFRVGERKGWKVYLLGAAPEVVQTAAKRIRELYPRLEIAGVRDGYFREEQDEEVVREVSQSGADILLVARSADKQEPWIGKYKSRLGVPVMMGVGGSFDILAGKLRRAPVLFQKLRLEWFYRLLQEPSRYKRMLVLPKFAWKVIREKEKVGKTSSQG